MGFNSVFKGLTEDEMLGIGYFVHPVKCPLLLNDQYENNIGCCASLECDMVTVSKRSHE
jgi:hypothetical protein